MTTGFSTLIAEKQKQGEPALYTIPSGVSFVDMFAQTMLDWAQDDALSLSQYLILLPSRRACRSLRDAFLRLTDGRPLILPRMQPVGDVDDEGLDVLLSATLAEMTDVPENVLDIPPAITPLHRQILLARVIHAVGENKNISPSYEQALSLAAELGTFLDEIQTERLSFDGLKTLVTEKEFAQHWQLTLDFLSILTEYWPAILEEQGLIDPAERRNRLLEAQSLLWSQQAPRHNVIVAGVTGSVPAVRDLIKVVSEMPNGMVVFPALDNHISEDDWRHVRDDHPQYYLKILLEHLQAERKDVSVWPSAAREDNPAVKLLSEAMRPAITTDSWRDLSIRDIDETALAHINRIDCKTAQDEAAVIALAMREALETPEKTAVLITPDRKLSQRVQACLQRWDVACDDSGGVPLSETAVGRWLLLNAEMMQKQCAPVALLSCLGHPFAAAGLETEDMRIWRLALDKHVLRDQKFIDLPRYFAEAPEDNPYREGWTKFNAASAAFLAMSDETHDLLTWMQHHIACAESLAATPDMEGANIVWRNEDGEAAARFLHDIQSLSADIPDLTAVQYIALLQNLMKTMTVRPRYNIHPRLAILGQIEARLYTADLVIIGSVNEGTWPHDPGHDPWMSRPMRQQYGLPPAERRIGMEAHDFVQAACAPEVLITRAHTIEGTPTVPARWLLRMETVLQAVGLEWPKREDLKFYAEALDKPEHIEACARPAPCPPVSARPRRLSVTRIEAWMRDPYNIYARDILKLKPLDPLDKEPGAAERGQIMHRILENFVYDYCMEGVPDNAYDLLIACGREAFIQEKLSDELYVFWWPRFERMAAALVEHEREWQQEASPYVIEDSGKAQFDAPYAPFTLTARVDRIDVMRADKKAAIIDYKTGKAPGAADMIEGFSPQLPLEALLVASTAFTRLQAHDTSELMFWQVSGGYPPLKVSRFKQAEVQQAIANAEKGLPQLIAAFDNDDTPYYAIPYFDKKPAYNDYAHLERLSEWGYVEKL